MTDWLKDCEVCNAGLVTEIDRIMEKEGIGQKKASKILVEQQIEKIGTEIYSAESIRQKYIYYKGSNKKGRNSTPESNADQNAPPLHTDNIEPGGCLKETSNNAPQLNGEEDPQGDGPEEDVPPEPGPDAPKEKPPQEWPMCKKCGLHKAEGRREDGQIIIKRHGLCEWCQQEELDEKRKIKERENKEKFDKIPVDFEVEENWGKFFLETDDRINSDDLSGKVGKERLFEITDWRNRIDKILTDVIEKSTYKGYD